MANKKIENAPYKLLDCLSTSILKSLLKQDLNDSEDELSVETIEYIVHLLDERSREIVTKEKETDIDSAWKQFIRCRKRRRFIVAYRMRSCIKGRSFASEKHKETNYKTCNSLYGSENRCYCSHNLYSFHDNDISSGSRY